MGSGITNRYLPVLNLKFRYKTTFHSSFADYTSLTYFSKKEIVTEWNSLKPPFLRD